MSNYDSIRALRVLALFAMFVAVPGLAYGVDGSAGTVWAADAVGGWASDRIIVRLRPAAATAARRQANPAMHANPGMSDGFQHTCNRWGVGNIRSCVRRGFSDAGLATDLGLDRTFVVEVPAGTDVASMVKDFSRLGGEVEFAGLDGIGNIAGEVVPNDTYFEDQWALKNTGQTNGTPGADIDATQAWAIHTGNPGTVTIAVVDSGVSLHNDYSANVIGGVNTAVAGGSLSDFPNCPHGTHVTGIAAAIGNNELGVAGVSWGANILRVRALGSCSGFVSDVADGIIWAADNGADIINISLQFYNLSPTSEATFESAVDYAFNSGALVVAAAGNGHGFDVAFPAEFDNAMAVSATNDEDLISSISNFGLEVSVSAPGETIWSTFPDPSNSYEFLSGTSMATPHVSGLAALLKSYLPGITNVELWDMIEATTDDLGSPGFDIYFGAGRINAGSAMAAAAEIPRIISSDPPDGAIDARQPSGIDGLSAQGWESVKLTFNQDPAALIADDFIVLVDGVASGGPSIIDVVDEGFGSATVVLDGPIPVGSWTTVRHRLTETETTLGFLPGDVSGDGVTGSSDILALIDGLNGVTPTKDWQSDIDRSDESNSVDILRLIDLLNGAGAYDVYLDATLP